MNTAQSALMYHQRVKDLEAAMERIAELCNDPLIKRATKLRERIEAEARYTLAYRLPPSAQDKPA